MYIHPQSVVSSRAKIGRDVVIGPFCVVEEGAHIGNGCRLEGRVTIKQGTHVGENNHIFEGCVFGGWPQHLASTDACGEVIIGSGNIIRENVTVHRAMKEGIATVVGDNCMIMVNAHIAHDCRVGDNVIMANNVMLAGHVSIGNRANLSGAVGVHQFCRIGDYAMVGGQAHVMQDVPPYMTVDGLTSRIVGLNQIGLRRAGFSTEDIKQLKAVYRIIFRSQMLWRDILKTLKEQFANGPGMEMSRFLETTTRGIVSERRSGGAAGPATVRIHDADIGTEPPIRFQVNAG